MKMREKIARAIRFSGGVPAHWSESDIQRHAEQYAEADLQAADAVLAAIREPTEEMETAGNEAFMPDPEPSSHTIWQAMIDAA